MMISKAILVVVCVVTSSVWSKPDGCEDVTVVGGGLSGAYTSWRLRHRGMHVGLYELSNRLGGRFYTHIFPQAPDIPVELGAMRFKRNHKVLYRTIQKVGLKTRLFERKQPDNTNLFYLRGKRLSKEDFIRDNVPYNVRPNESHGLDSIYRYLTLMTNFSGNTDSLEQERPFLISNDGELMINQTLQEFYRKYLSSEAVEMVYDTRFGFFMDMPAASGFLSPSGISPYDKTMTIMGGMQQLPEQLVKQFLATSRYHSLHLGHKLISITKNRWSRSKLKFSRTANGHLVTVCSRKVILAVPIPALLQINWDVVQAPRIQQNMNTITPCMLAKIFLVYEYPWWRDIVLNVTGRQSQTPRTHGNIKSDIPLQWTYDFGVSVQTGKAVLLVAYTENPMWMELQKHGDRKWAGPDSVSTEVVRHTHLYLARLYNIPLSSIPFPIDGRLSHWDEYPYKGSFFIWKTGVDWGHVWRTINKPSALDDVFIASGAYWNSQSDTWSENCLNAINEMLQKYF